MPSRKPTGMNVPAFTGAIQPTASTRILERRWLPRCCNLSAAQGGDVEGDPRPNPLSGARHDQARRMPEANGGSEIAVDSETFDNALPVLGPGGESGAAGEGSLRLHIDWIKMAREG